MLNNKITFIGGGNMAEGIIRGIITNKVFAPKNITVFDILSERRSYLNSTYEIEEAEDASSAVKGTDIVLIAVRPQDIIKVAQNIKNDLSEFYYHYFYMCRNKNEKARKYIWKPSQICSHYAKYHD